MTSLDREYEELGRRDSQLRAEDSRLRSEKQSLRKILDTRKSCRTNISTRENK